MFFKNHSILVYCGLWIRIKFLRIRIKLSFYVVPDPNPVLKSPYEEFLVIEKKTRLLKSKQKKHGAGPNLLKKNFNKILIITNCLAFFLKLFCLLVPDKNDNFKITQDILIINANVPKIFYNLSVFKSVCFESYNLRKCKKTS